MPETIKPKSVLEHTFRPSRRKVLMGAAALGAGWTSAAAESADATPQATLNQVTDAPSNPFMQSRVPYLGEHQAGITTPRPLAGMVASFYVLAENRDQLERLLRGLTERIAF